MDQFNQNDYEPQYPNNYEFNEEEKINSDPDDPNNL